MCYTDLNLVKGADGITDSSVVEGQIEIYAGSSIIGLSHPAICNRINSRYAVLLSNHLLDNNMCCTSSTSITQ